MNIIAKHSIGFQQSGLQLFDCQTENRAATHDEVKSIHLRVMDWGRVSGHTNDVD
jgi:hypothetical protein